MFSAGLLALSAEMRPDHLLFNGSKKSLGPLPRGQTGVRVSVDSIDNPAFERAAGGGTTVDIAFRVSPAIDVPTHPSRDGPCHEQVCIRMDHNAYRHALAARHINPGIHCHIGSQILDVEPFAARSRC